MSTGRRFTAQFADEASKKAYLTWSAGQMFVYNEAVREQRYFDSLSWLIAETKARCQPIRPSCCVERPLPDQKYSHLIDPEQLPWFAEVPSAVLGIGGYRFYQASQWAMRGLSRRPKVHPIKIQTASYCSRERISALNRRIAKVGLSFLSEAKENPADAFSLKVIGTFRFRLWYL